MACTAWYGMGDESGCDYVLGVWSEGAGVFRSFVLSRCTDAEMANEDEDTLAQTHTHRHRYGVVIEGEGGGGGSGWYILCVECILLCLSSLHSTSRPLHRTLRIRACNFGGSF